MTCGAVHPSPASVGLSLPATPAAVSDGLLNISLVHSVTLCQWDATHFELHMAIVSHIEQYAVSPGRISGISSQGRN